MEIIFRTTAIYFFLLVTLRLGGQTTLAQTSTFDFLLLLIISEAIQQALINSDNSITAAFLIVGTLFFLSVTLSLLRQRSSLIEKLFEGTPIILVENGQMIKTHMDKTRIDQEDIMASARKDHGIERLDKIKYAILEKNGQISIIPI